MPTLITKLESILQRDGLLLKDKYDEWVKVSRLSGETLDRVLTSSGYLTEDQMLAYFGECLDIEVKDRIADNTVPETFLTKVPVSFARNHNMVGIEESEAVMTVASCYPLDLHPMDNLSSMIGKTVNPIFATRSDITALINSAYQQKVDVVDEMLEDLDADDIDGLTKEIELSQDLLDIANKAPIIRLVNMIMFQALKMRASDIHIQPYEEKLQIRYRVDGIVYDMMMPPKKIQDAIVSRIKIMGKMDIAERRLPQDGRASLKVGDSDVDVRISSVPTSYGERIVLRLLDKSGREYDLKKLGLDEADHIEVMDSLLASSHGIILVTGPTGSGKTTTLYSALTEVNSSEKNVITIEDPIEYQLPGISQIEVATKKGLTFASGLRSIVRQDPDIIMVGEIRDLETATIAIQSALTGHLVFSTLHTNDAPGAVTRLLDLGIEPYLVTSSLIGVIAQRLVRIVCQYCRESRDPDVELLRQIGLTMEDLPQGKVYYGKGCPRCFQSGYLDRTAIYEMLRITDEVREQVINQSSSTLIKKVAIQNGMRTLRMGGARKVMAGITTPEEVLRVTQMDAF